MNIEFILNTKNLYSIIAVSKPNEITSICEPNMTDKNVIINVWPKPL